MGEEEPQGTKVFLVVSLAAPSPRGYISKGRRSWGRRARGGEGPLTLPYGDRPPIERPYFGSSENHLLGFDR